MVENTLNPRQDSGSSIWDFSSEGPNTERVQTTKLHWNVTVVI